MRYRLILDVVTDDESFLHKRIEEAILKVDNTILEAEVRVVTLASDDAISIER